MNNDTEVFRIKKITMDKVRKAVAKSVPKSTIGGFVEMAIQNELKKSKYKNLLV